MQNSLPVIFIRHFSGVLSITQPHTATAGSSCASINAGSPSKTWRCLHTVPEGVPVRPGGICVCRFIGSAITSVVVSVHTPAVSWHFRSNDVVAGIFKCLCQRSGQRDFHHINGVTIFAINTSHHMPATIRQLLNKRIPERYLPTFSTLPRYCSFPPRRASLTRAVPSLMAGRLPRLTRILAVIFPDGLALNTRTR